MKSKRIVKGNFTTIPTGADVIGDYQTLAVTETQRRGPGNIPLSSAECVVEAREFMEENKK